MTMKYSISSSPLLLLLFFLSVAAVSGLDTCVPSNFGEFSIDNIQCYVIAPGQNAEFTCQIAGSQVGIGIQDFAARNVRGTSVGLPQASGAGLLWTTSNTPEDDELILTNCQIETGCLIQTFNDCECTQNDGQGSNTTCASTTASPTPAPSILGPPTAPQCPETTSTQFCGELLTEHPPIPFTACDCYNYCQTEFISCCNWNSITLQWDCGNIECAATDAPGTSVDAQVLGCYRGHMNDYTPPEDDDDDNNNGSGGGGNRVQNDTSGGAMAVLGVVSSGMAMMIMMMML